MCVYIYIYIYIHVYVCVYLSLSLYTYIYIYIYRCGRSSPMLAPAPPLRNCEGGCCTRVRQNLPISRCHVQSYVSKGHMTTGHRLFCKEFLRFGTMPCRQMPLMCTSDMSTAIFFLQRLVYIASYARAGQASLCSRVLGCACYRTGVCEQKHSFCTSLGHAIQQQKLQSSP